MLGHADRYGQRYVIDFEFQGPVGQAMIRSARIIRTNETVPRLVTCYILQTDRRYCYMTQSRKPKLLDLVAVLKHPPDVDVEVGDVGTVVEQLPPDGVEVEFLGRDGRTRCLATDDSRKSLTRFRNDVVGWTDGVPKQGATVDFVNPIKRLPHVPWVLSHHQLGRYPLRLCPSPMNKSIVCPCCSGSWRTWVFAP
jgi:hypothetical protein